MLEAKRVRGDRIGVANPGLTIDQAIGRAVNQFRPAAQPRANGSWDRRAEPAWHDPNNLLAIGAAESFSNIGDLRAAFSTGIRLFIDLPVLRNYFAHRNQQTSEAATAVAPHYGIPATKRPSRVVLSRPLKRPQPLLLDWMDEMQVTIELVCY